MIEDDEEETIQSVKQPNFKVPDNIEQPDNIPQVVPISSPEPSYDEMTPVQRIISTKSESSNTEHKIYPELIPLSFTVDEIFFDLKEIWDGFESKYEYEKRKKITPEPVVRKALYKVPNKYIEHRGLLQLNKFGDIELLFPAKEGFEPKASYGETDDLAKTEIYLDTIESISFDKSVFKSKAKLIIKVKPETYIHRLAIDQVEREIMLYIVRKNKKQAEQIFNVILMRLSDLQKKKIFKAKKPVIPLKLNFK